MHDLPPTEENEEEMTYETRVCDTESEEYE